MSKDDLIRRGGAMSAEWVNAIKAPPPFTAADLDAAFRLGLEMASEVAWPWRHQGQPDFVHQSGDWSKWRISETILALTPPVDLAERVKQNRKGYGE